MESEEPEKTESVAEEYVESEEEGEIESGQDERKLVIEEIDQGVVDVGDSEDRAEEEEEEQVARPGRRRCQRKTKFKKICLIDCGDEQQEGEGGAEGLEGEEDEWDEEGEEEEEEDEDSGTISVYNSILSVISFEWEGRTYEFDELCDPGIIADIYKISKTVREEYMDDIGELRYLNKCKSLGVAPIVRLTKALYTQEIDLSFRLIDAKNVEAMCSALEINSVVERLILKYNTLSTNDCYHLGNALRANEKISHLDLTGSRIHEGGLEYLFEYLEDSETILHLNLSKCNIGDAGAILLARAIFHNNSIEYLNLSHNDLKETAAMAMSTALKYNKSITELNLCYNKLFEPAGLKEFFKAMAMNDTITTLNFAWNAVSGQAAGGFISNFLRRNKVIQCVDLSNNRLEGLAISQIKNGLSRSRNLRLLLMGYNPMTPEDAEILLSGAKGSGALEELDLSEVWVNKTFMKALAKVQATRVLDVKVGGVFSNYELRGQDFQKILFRRANFEAMKPKKAKLRKDFGDLVWTLGDEPITPEEFMEKFKKFKAKVAQSLIEQIINEFNNPKLNLVDVIALRAKYLSLYPDSKPPPAAKSAKEKSGIKLIQAESRPVLEEDVVTFVADESTEHGLEDLVIESVPKFVAENEENDELTLESASVQEGG